MMIVGLNLLFLIPGQVGGTETYAKNIIKALYSLNEPGIQWVVFINQETPKNYFEALPGIKLVKCQVHATSRIKRYAYEQLIFPSVLKKHKVTVLHSLGYVGPLLFKNQVVTIHDTNAFAHQDSMPYAKRLLLGFFLKSVARTCKCIITVSSFSKEEIIKHLKVLPQKVKVIYEAGRYGSGPVNTIQSGAYFLALSSLSTHKNIITLLKAFVLLNKKKYPVQLQLAGHLPPGNDLENFIQDEKLEQRIKLTGFVDDEKLKHLFSNALCFVFPSLYEGFGLPLLEAQQLGTPVIASNRGSLPEIGGDSAIYFDALDAEDLALKMEQLLLNNALREQYKKAGLVNCRRFSWHTAALETAEVYRTLNDKN